MNTIPRRMMILAGVVGILSAELACSHTTRQSADEAWEMGMYWYRRGRYTEALKKFDDAHRLNPGESRYILGQINASRELGNTALLKKEMAEGDRHHKYAIERSVELINQHPSDSTFYYTLGVIYYERYANQVAEFTREQRGDYMDKALSSLTKSLQLNPEAKQDFYVHKYLGLLLISRTKADVEAGKTHLRTFLQAARGVLHEMSLRQAKNEEDVLSQERLRREIEDIVAILKELS